MIKLPKEIKLNNLICPECGKMLEVTSYKKDGTKYQSMCRNCLTYWDFIKYEMSDDDIRELARE